MITGGDEREDARMTRADRLLIRNAIFLAAKTVKAAGRDQVLTHDVVEALQSIGHDETLPDHRRNRAIEMSDGMALFCSGLAGHFFNREGSRWPDVDVTHLDMGILQREGYEDQLTVGNFAQAMQLLGYRNVVSLKTGLRGWKDYEQPLVDQVGDAVDLRITQLGVGRQVQDLAALPAVPGTEGADAVLEAVDDVDQAAAAGQGRDVVEVLVDGRDERKGRWRGRTPSSRPGAPPRRRSGLTCRPSSVRRPTRFR